MHKQITQIFPLESITAAEARELHSVGMDVICTKGQAVVMEDIQKGSRPRCNATHKAILTRHDYFNTARRRCQC